jgi:hypothetical protein
MEIPFSGSFVYPFFNCSFPGILLEQYENPPKDNINNAMISGLMLLFFKVIK